MRVLVVEDERRWPTRSPAGCGAEGMAVDVAYDGDAGHEKSTFTRYDVVVLDRDLPGMRGDDLCAQIVASGATTRVLCSPRAARWPTRSTACPAAPTTTWPSRSPSPSWWPGAARSAGGRRRRRRRCCVAGDVVLDPARRTVSRAERPLELTRKEFGVLEVLLAARGAVVCSEELLERVWDENADPFTTTVRVTVMTLRKKLGEPGVIETVVGAGYRVRTVTPSGAEHGARHRGAPVAGLRPVGGSAACRLTAVCTGVVALVSALLLWLGWLLVGGCGAGCRRCRRAATVRVGGRMVPSEQVSAAVGAAARERGAARRGWSRSRWWWWPRALVSWWLVGRVLGPLHAVTATARRLSVESLDTRTGVRDARGEVAELAAGFDAMLDRLQAAFEAQRRFVANASHELRTPLSVMRTEVDVTLADPAADVEELRRMGAVVRDATRRADDLVAGLLLLARAESGAELGERAPGGPRRPGGARARRRAGRRDRAAACGCCCAPHPPRRTATPCCWSGWSATWWRTRCGTTSRAGWLEVCTRRRGSSGTGSEGGAELRVASSGPEVAPDRVDELFEPFRRGPVERTGAAPRCGARPLDRPRGGAAHGGTVEARPVRGRRPVGDRPPPRLTVSRRFATVSRTFRHGELARSGHGSGRRCGAR